MGQTHFKAGPTPGTHESRVNATHPGAHHGEAEVAVHVLGDPSEGPAVSWEAAWIDLGGEG